MKNIRVAILALCVGALGSMVAQAQATPSVAAFPPPNWYCGNTDNYITNGDACWGYDSLPSPYVGGYNSAFGSYALYSNGDSYYNTATGYSALYSNTTANFNTAIGYEALYSNTTGNENTALGTDALTNNIGSGANTATGTSALQDNTTGSENTATGYNALSSNTTANYNTAIGTNSLLNNTTGAYNIGVGYEAGSNVNTGSYNIDIGGAGSSDESDTIRIGTPGTQASFYAAGVDGVGVSGGVAVYINSSGQLGTVNSSIRFKEDVHDMGDASSAIFRLRPVTYRYKQPYADGSKPIDYGLIAEEVSKVYPDMVVKGADGQIQTVQYQKLTPMLLNEVQKQHRLLEQMGRALKLQQETIQILKTQQAETV